MTGEPAMAQLGTGVGSRMDCGKANDANSGAKVDSKSGMVSQLEINFDIGDILCVRESFSTAPR
jgi:hypothetical protein